MNTGNNVPFAVYRKVVETPAMRAGIVNMLKDLHASRKVMRYPDGGETLQQGFDLVFLRDWVAFALEAGVEKVIFRADFSAMNESVTVYEILKQDFDVIAVEASNEPFYSPWDDPKGWREILTKMFNKTAFFKLKANQYADMVIRLRNVFVQRGHYIDPIYAFACPVPNNHKLRTWYSTIHAKLKGIVRIASVHVYGDPSDPLWINKTEDAIRVISPEYQKICTEFNGIHFGRHGNTNFPELAFTSTHKRLNNGLIDLFKRNGFLSAIQHCMFHTNQERFFGRMIVRPDGSVEDRMPESAGWMHQ